MDNEKWGTPRPGEITHIPKEEWEKMQRERRQKKEAESKPEPPAPGEPEKNNQEGK